MLRAVYSLVFSQSCAPLCISPSLDIPRVGLIRVDLLPAAKHVHEINATAVHGDDCVVSARRAVLTDARRSGCELILLRFEVDDLKSARWYR